MSGFPWVLAIALCGQLSPLGPAARRLWEREEPNAAYFIHPGIICEQAVRIIWSADASGKLTSTGGDYKSHCI